MKNQLYLSNCSKRQRERVIYSTFLLLFRDIDLARVRPHFNPSLFCLPKMGETREHLLLYPFSDQKPNICCHRCSISNQLKNTPFHKKLMTMFVNVETNSYFPINYFDDFLFYWFLCFMDSPSKIFIFKFIRVAVGKKSLFQIFVKVYFMVFLAP